MSRGVSGLAHGGNRRPAAPDRPPPPSRGDLVALARRRLLRGARLAVGGLARRLGGERPPRLDRLLRRAATWSLSPGAASSAANGSVSKSSPPSWRCRGRPPTAGPATPNRSPRSRTP